MSGLFSFKAVIADCNSLSPSRLQRAAARLKGTERFALTMHCKDDVSGSCCDGRRTGRQLLIMLQATS